MRDAEKRWGVTDIEGLGLVEGIKNCAFLSSGHFLVFTDHISLKFLQSMKNTHGRLFRWSLLLQNLKFTVQHKPGKTNSDTDDLSRREYPPTVIDDPDDDFVNDSVGLASIDSRQNNEQAIETSVEKNETENLDEPKEMTVVHLKYHKVDTNRKLLMQPSGPDTFGQECTATATSKARFAKCVRKVSMILTHEDFRLFRGR